MPDVVERDEVAVLFIRVADEVPAMQRGWAELEAIVGLRGRHFYGVFDGKEYLVCAAVRDGDDEFELERGTIPSGRYLRERLHGEPPAVYERIGPTFAALEASADVDSSRPLIEHYRRHDEIDILVPVN